MKNASDIESLEEVGIQERPVDKWSTFTFLGKSEVKKHAGVGFGGFSNSSEVFLRSFCLQLIRRILSVEDFRLLRAWPFEGARLFTGETTRVSWTPVKLA